MRKTIILAGCLLLGFAAWAQTPASPQVDQSQTQAMPQGGRGHHYAPMTADDRLNRLDDQLKLSDDQKAKIKPLLEDEQKKISELRQSGTRREMFSKFREIHDATDEQVRAVLTPEQQKTFDQAKKERQERMGRYGHGRRTDDATTNTPQNQ